jgi:hypothetical protein
VHYVCDVTQGEDASRIRVQPLPNLFALARNLALNLYRKHDFENMAQAQHRAGQGLKLLQSLFRLNNSALKVQRFLKGLKAQVNLFEEKVIVILI